MKTFLRKLAWLTQRDRREADLRAELEFHLEEEAESRETEAVSPTAARFAARRELGNVTRVAEETRAAWGWTLAEQFAQDIRYAWRMMKQNRAFTSLAVLSLALGIGANTAIYSFMDAILLRSLPVSDPKSLALMNWRMKSEKAPSVFHSMSGSTYDGPNGGMEAGIFPYPAFELLHQSTDVFSSFFAYYPARDINLIVGNQAEIIRGEHVSGEYFRGLGVTPAAGRLIGPDDDLEAHCAVAVLSYTASRRRFGNPAGAIGQVVRINNIPFTVIGVTPPEFFGVDPSDLPQVYLPFRANTLLWGEPHKSYADPNFYWVEMMGRLRPGVSFERATALLGPRFQQWVAGTAADDRERANLPALWVREGASGLDVLRRRYSQPLYVLFAMVGLVLLIACANIANLLLARATARRREMAVRLSIGAGRTRVIRQLLTESVMLASIGGALGVLFAIWGVQSLTVLLANGREEFTLHTELNWHVLGVALALSIFTGALFGLAPALQSTKADVMPALKESRSAGRPGRALPVSLSHVLVVSQIAMSLIMLVAAGLFVRTLSNLASIRLGFNPETMLLFSLNAEQAGHKDAERDAFYYDLQKRFASIPGVAGAVMSNSPLLGEGTWATPVAAVSKEKLPDFRTHVLTVGAGYFSTMQIPLIAGRDFNDQDRPGAPAVAIINQTWAKAHFGDRNPIGEHIYFTKKDKRLSNEPLRVIGVSGDIRYGALTGNFPAVVYVPLVQAKCYPPDDVTYALRTHGDPMRYVRSVREIVRQADSHVPVTKFRTQNQSVDSMMNQEIIFARLCTGFALLALVIACIGLYGTMSYTVARRKSEIGIRMALGARRSHVLGMVMRQVLAMAVAGLAVGLPGVYNLTHLVESFLFGVKPHDSLIVLISTALLALAAGLAGYIPAYRAAQIHPIQALRHE